MTAAGGLTDRPQAVTALADVQRLVGADAIWWRGDPWPHERAFLPTTCAVDPYPMAIASAGASVDGTADERDGSFTSHLSVVDEEGNAVSATTTTVGVLFGSGIYTGGFFLNSSANNLDDRTRGTDRYARYANSTMAPTIILQGSRSRHLASRRAAWLILHLARCTRCTCDGMVVASASRIRDAMGVQWRNSA